jgi:Tfp pilus assembly protein PilF
MKINTIILLLIIVAVSFLQSCSKRTHPTTFKGKEISAYDSTKFDYVFIEAIKQKFLGNAGDALKYLEQCIKINPGSDAAYFEMAQISLMLSDYIRGKQYILKALSMSEKNIWYLTLAANLYYQEKNIDSAVYYYEKAVNYNPEKEDLKVSLAKIYSENKYYKKAAEIYNYLENKYGVTESTTLSILRNQINSGDYKSAETKVKDLIQTNPEEIFFYGLLAEIYRKSGDTEKAAGIYKELMDSHPGNPQVQISLCDFMLNEKQYSDLLPVLSSIAINDSISREDKLAIFSKVISDTSFVKTNGSNIEITLILLEADNKDDGILVLLRPELYINQKNIGAAKTRLEEIVAQQEENYFAWEKLLFLYSETKDWDKLMEKGEECATKFNTAYVPKMLYASAAIEREKFSLAEEELRKAKILAGNDTAKIMQVLVMNADVFYRKKEFIKSFEAFKEALKLNPEDVIILNNYAYYLAEQGQELKEAERMAKLVIQKEKENSTYLDTYSWVLYKRGRFKEAEKIMEKAIKNSVTEDAVYFEHMGYIQKAMKQCTKAVANWKTALKLDSSKTLLIKEIENCGTH